MQFLVLARVAEGIAMEQVLPYVKVEAEAVWQKYSAEIVRSIYYIADMSGAVLMCEAPNLEAMQESVAQFPMAKVGVLKFEILPLKPYVGLESLFAKS
jgi:hypothetical protein